MNDEPNDLTGPYRALSPEIPETALPAAIERFERYVRLASEIVTASDGHLSGALTEPSEGAKLSAGKVDPTRTFTKTG